MTNPRGISGSLADAMVGADVFIGVSGGSVDPALVETMGPQPIIFALANPTPEIDPREAARRGAAVVATGRSDYANQINNVLAFPGIFLGALDCGARRITEGMKVAAVRCDLRRRAGTGQCGSDRAGSVHPRARPDGGGCGDERGPRRGRRGRDLALLRPRPVCVQHVQISAALGTPIRTSA